LRETDQNSIFVGHKAHIPDQLHIMVPYISFCGFYFFFKFHLKIQRVSLRFYRKRQFVTKADQNSIFVGHKAHILDQLHIMVPYISFADFFFQISSQNPKRLTFRFTKKCQFAAKTNQNFVFLIRKAEILDQLYTMVMYRSFSRYFKILNFGSKLKGSPSVLLKKTILRPK
jgi:hypothetical protein